MHDESSYFDAPGFQETAISEELIPLYSSESGLCELYKARRDGKIVVYKALKQKFRDRPEFESILRKEFEIGYGLDHPGLCRTLSYETVDGLGKCIIMEWIDGSNLSEFCSSRDLDRALTAKLISEICDALNYLHSHQIIHRDLKPGNIMVTRNGLNVKLIDFGLADTDNYCIHKEPAGTLRYASPEQIEGAELDARSDIHSLGIIISEIGGDKYRKIASRCSCKDRSKRFQTVAEVKSAIARASRRPRFLTIAAAAVLVLLATMLLAPTKRQNSDGPQNPESSQKRGSISSTPAENYDSVIQDATQSILDLQD